MRMADKSCTCLEVFGEDPQCPLHGVQAIVKRLRDGDPSVVDEAADLIEEFIDKLECQGRRSCGCDKTGGNPHGPSK